MLGTLIAGVLCVKKRGRSVLVLAALMGILFTTLGFPPNLFLVMDNLVMFDLKNGFWSLLEITRVQKVAPMNSAGSP